MYSVYFKHYRQLPYELQVDRLLHDFNFLNESQHIYKGSRNAVHYIAEHIFNDLSNQRYKAQDFNSGFSFISNYGVAISDKEADTIDMHSNFKKFPINVHYEYIEDNSLFMFVCDRAIHTNDIMIVVNTYRMIPYLDSFKNKIETKKKANKFNEALDDDYDYFLLVPKIKHEFLHIRQNYGLTFKDISQTKKMVNIDIEQLFNFKYNDYIYEIIKRYMYMFSFSELSQRINETVEIIYCLSDEKIMFMTSDCTQRSDCCTKMFNYTSSVHMVPQMRELKNDISDTIQEDGFDIVMPIAYFFNHYKMFKM